ncbi:MAG: adenylosuccinate lyase [Phycisphaerales bacterium]|nr:adenylosuccinate lyase [Phycisphaerales bacterium]
MSPYDTYTSPLAARNASEAMLRLWSPRHKFNTWRRIWLAVAEAQHEITKDQHPDKHPNKQPDRQGGLSSPAPQESPPSRSGCMPGPLVTKEQVEELRAVVNRGITDEEMKAAEKYERDLRHDVMAHVHALGDSCPKAKGIIHLGMTSQDVVCNAEFLILQQSLHLTRLKLTRVIAALAEQARRWASLPTLGFTHYQPAQPVTAGRRVAGWASDLVLALRRVDTLHPYTRTVISDIAPGCAPPRGLRGATGTQASFVSLLDGPGFVDHFESRVQGLAFDGLLPGFADNLIVPAGSDKDYPAGIAEHAAKIPGLVHDPLEAREVHFDSNVLTGQTYPRVIDTFILADLASTAAVLHKIATDIRLLCNRKELDEPFEDKQIGSSAMPYKRNPMRCERICGLTRFVMNLVGNAYDTAATQWLERTLDDSSNRRLSLPEAFLALDGALDLMHNVASGLIVHEAMVRKNLMAELIPFMATENILMACVKLGGDRQHYHELIRVHAQAAGMRVKQEGLDNDLLERLRGDKAFWGKARGGPLAAELDWDNLMDPMQYVGRSVEQTERFIKDVVEPLRERYKDAIAQLGESGPRV